MSHIELGQLDVFSIVEVGGGVELRREGVPEVQSLAVRVEGGTSKPQVVICLFQFI